MAPEGHNSETLANKRQAFLFYQAVAELSELETKEDEIKGKKKVIFEKLKANGVSKRTYDMSKKLRKDPDSLQILIGDLSDAIDFERLDPAEFFPVNDGEERGYDQKAYNLGYVDGRKGLANKNPYTEQDMAQSWQKGFNQGVEDQNIDRKVAMDESAAEEKNEQEESPAEENAEDNVIQLTPSEEPETTETSHSEGVTEEESPSTEESEAPQEESLAEETSESSESTESSEAEPQASDDDMWNDADPNNISVPEEEEAVRPETVPAHFEDNPIDGSWYDPTGRDQTTFTRDGVAMSADPGASPPQEAPEELSADVDDDVVVIGS